MSRLLIGARAKRLRILSTRLDKMLAVSHSRYLLLLELELLRKLRKKVKVTCLAGWYWRCLLWSSVRLIKFESVRESSRKSDELSKQTRPQVECNSAVVHHHHQQQQRFLRLFTSTIAILSRSWLTFNPTTKQLPSSSHLYLPPSS